MSTVVSVNTYAHTVTHVATKMLLSFKEIIRQIGLDPGKLTEDWEVLERGISTWLHSRHLTRVTLEVFDPKNDKLVTRWDMQVVYGYTGDGSLWVDTDALRYAIAKAGLVASKCNYRIVTTTEPGRPDVEGWSKATLRSTDHLNCYTVGSTVGGNGLAAETSYWR